MWWSGSVEGGSAWGVQRCSIVPESHRRACSTRCWPCRRGEPGGDVAADRAGGGRSGQRPIRDGDNSGPSRTARSFRAGRRRRRRWHADRVRAVRWRCARRDGLRRATAASGRCHETFGVRGVPAGSSPDADLSGSADPVGRAGCRAAVPDREDGWAGFHRRRHAHGAGAGRRGRDGGRQAQVFQQARRARHQ